MGKQRTLPLFAITLLLLGSLATLYVHANTTHTQTITINNQEFSYEQIQTNTKPRTIDTYTGIALDDFIQKSGITKPPTHNYLIIGSDGYQKTVQWTHLTTGLLTPEGEVIFSTLPKAFRVKNVIQIEVI
jgi:hypothetical protein